MTRRNALTLIFALILTIAGISGCSTGSNSGDYIADLQIVYTSPADSANASRETLVVVAFNQNLKESTITADNFYVTDSAGTKVNGSIEYFSINNRIIFTSENFYQIGETYTVYVKKDIQSAESEKMKADYIFNFNVTH